jgi:hypothetical protein
MIKEMTSGNTGNNPTQKPNKMWQQSESQAADQTKSYHHFSKVKKFICNFAAT